ncbi:8-amino-7-oxononanoate synthase [Vibrio sp. CAIM 722]|uniref:8-amino-7-oxononanoate synthase n=2 Tax=Vibrio eleionomae TaxID=2653505 RepID=A0A7X4RW04_9VIBR|nr:8-amino-7-oxononanoate synthase [Vibrio eleionomae]MZI95108.1 8-amino-7-oxononanoate synthase [Vibrio eleionomae]
MMPVFKQRIQEALSLREAQGLTRSPVVLERVKEQVIASNQGQAINFSSNDYLGLASSKELADAWQQGIRLYGCGSGASPLVTGFSPAHARLTDQLCEWLGFEGAVLFNSGFSANQAVLLTLLEKDDVVLQDKLNHASLIEAGMLSTATVRRFKHNDLGHLQRLLPEKEDTLVVTEGVFSMDGDAAPLAQMMQQTKDRAWLMVDDAHGLGVWGPDGRGSCARAGISPDILVVTFGKGAGISGAAVLASHVVTEYLLQFARHYVYSTAMPAAQAYALSHSLTMLQTQSWRREHLAELNQAYCEATSHLPGYVATETPIKPFIVGDNIQAMEWSHSLKEKGFWTTAIRPPTVPKGSARLRITLNASHTTEQVFALGRVLESLYEEALNDE